MPSREELDGGEPEVIDESEGLHHMHRDTAKTYGIYGAVPVLPIVIEPVELPYSFTNQELTNRVVALETFIRDVLFRGIR